MTTPSTTEVIAEIKDLKVQFQLDEGTVHAVDGVSMHIHRSETLGIVGESGCGKSVSSQALMGMVSKPGKVMGGEIYYYRYNQGNAEKVDILKLNPKGKAIRRIRGGEISKIFQEPMTSFIPVYTIGDQIMEAILLHQNVNKREARQRTIEILRKVGFPQPEQRVDAYPHQLSGGLRQRAMIAMALSCNPTLLIADEPTTALDVTTEAQILDLMKRLQDELHMAIMIISHNMGVIAEMADRVIVMYLGKDVEQASVEDIFNNPLHPYTRDLLRSIPQLEGEQGRLHTIKGSIPDPYHIPKGCPYHLRCSDTILGTCDKQVPPLVEHGPDHQVRCWKYAEEGAV